MRYRLPCLALAAAVAFASPSTGQTPLGPDAAACASPGGETAAVVRVDGFKDRSGRLRIQLYGDEPDEFLEKGTKLKRIEIPLTPSGPMIVCVALPSPGAYAIAVLHDRNANRKLDVASDGVGFSGNPKLGLAKPKYRSVMFNLKAGITRMNIVLNYRVGLAVRPIAR